MLVSVHEVSCETPGMTSHSILRAIIKTMWMVHAPIFTPEPISTCFPVAAPTTHSPLHTFGVDPVRIEIGKGRLIAQLFYGLQWFLVDLEDTTRSPPPASLLITHIGSSVHSTPSRRVGTDVVGDGPGDENWRRQFGGIDGVRRGGGSVVGGRGHSESIEGADHSPTR